MDYVGKLWCNFSITEILLDFMHILNKTFIFMFSILIFIVLLWFLLFYVSIGFIKFLNILVQHVFHGFCLSIITLISCHYYQSLYENIWQQNCLPTKIMFSTFKTTFICLIISLKHHWYWWRCKLKTFCHCICILRLCAQLLSLLNFDYFIKILNIGYIKMIKYK